MSGQVRAMPRERCVLSVVLERRARERGDATFVVLEDGTSLTYAAMLEEARSTAAALQELGVQRGDTVLSWLPNGLAALKVWFGANLLGAIYVPINTSYRGGLLQHVVTNSAARVGVVHASLLERLGAIDTGHLREVIVVGGPSHDMAGLECRGEDSLDRDAALLDPAEGIESWDTQSIIYTSGTTGPSKGVISSYAHLASTVIAVFEGRFDANDRYMINVPLFHASGTIGVYAALLYGGSISVVDAFDTRTFWDVVRRTGTTWMTLLGVMASFLWKEPDQPDDADNPLRMVSMVPLIDDVEGFAKRFGLTVVTCFNMTETSVPVMSEENPATRGTCGRLRAGVQARLVDEYDNEVVDGEVGEMMVRTDEPWAMNSGYWKNPEATVRAWRNGWFHTGDAFRRVDGEYFFVDRTKDAIRRRGENISSFEVEAELLAHPAIREAAAVAVPSEYGEDDVMAVVAPVEGRQIDPGELLEFLRPRMAHFMVPRYVRVIDELPRTPTNKIQKHLLRQGGVTEDTWDREAAGVEVKRERLV